MFEIAFNCQYKIDYKGKKLRVFPIKNFPRSICLDLSGNLYMSYWPTPEKRDERKPRQYRMYKDIYSLFRAVMQTMERTKANRLPCLDQLTDDCREICADIRDIRKADEKDILKAQISMTKVLGQIMNGVTPEIREASEKVSFAIIFRDSLGRINTGMVSARLFAARNRIVERMQNILQWMRKYAEWKESIQTFVFFHKNYLPRLANRLKILIDSEVSNLFDSDKIGILINKLRNIWRELEHLIWVGGWKNWCYQIKKDINECLAKISEDGREKIKLRIEKIRQSVLLKIAQYTIHDILLDMDIELSQNVFEKSSHLAKIDLAISDVERIDDHDWRNPVCSKINSLLRTTVDVLRKSPLDKKNINASKKNLRMAYQII